MTLKTDTVSRTRVRIIGSADGMSYQLKTKLSKLGEDFDLSVCLGDVILDYSQPLHIKQINELDPTYVKIVQGNEDDPNKLTAHYLGDFGYLWTHLFYVRGEKKSPYLKELTNNNTEITPKQMAAAYRTYRTTKPKIVLTHACPNSLRHLVERMKKEFISKETHCSKTGKLFDMMLKKHQPEYWVFSHPRKSWREHLSGTTFISLTPLEHIDIDLVVHHHKKQTKEGGLSNDQANTTSSLC